eukprot:TRINITY_DN56646_c0_g1_i1.p1 TRINITY_DN56646_c0_g1~~TRINITY_DN56646_c0_g1_i1.p1  ORF type:complete len:232 (+),score=23.20 TRINITY_DN56646_c0_g1_i1:73-768(+)
MQCVLRLGSSGPEPSGDYSGVIRRIRTLLIWLVMADLVATLLFWGATRLSDQTGKLSGGRGIIFYTDNAADASARIDKGLALLKAGKLDQLKMVGGHRPQEGSHGTIRVKTEPSPEHSVAHFRVARWHAQWQRRPSCPVATIPPVGRGCQRLAGKTTNKTDASPGCGRAGAFWGRMARVCAGAIDPHVARLAVGAGADEDELQRREGAGLRRQANQACAIPHSHHTVLRRD